VASVGIFLGSWLASFLLLYVAWTAVVVMNGDAIFECDRGDCGPLGEWSYSHGGDLGVAFLLSGAGVGLLTATSCLQGRSGWRPFLLGLFLTLAMAVFLLFLLIAAAS
jgi:hypothetical protein